jgi:signal transduction histidine kinase
VQATASRFRFGRAVSLVASIAAISLLRYVTGPSPTLLHELSLRLYYIPILVGAYWYGVFGGLAIAAISSVAYVNRASELVSTFDRGRLAEVAVFHLVAIAVGLLANAQRRANAKLRDSYEEIRRIDRLRTLGEVAAGLAHELRHPLASISGALEIIESRAQADSPEAEFSRLAMAEVRRLDQLVWEFLRYARPHAPELRISPVHEIVLQTMTLLGVEAERARVELAVDSGVPDVRARIDPLQIEQVLLNVVLNAVQASPQGGRVRILETMAGRDVCIDVIDQGAGIATEHRPRIFEPFFTTRDKGTGLGLAIAQRIVLAHGGSLEIAETSASGTRVRILLPTAGPASLAAAGAFAADAL